MSKLKSTTEDEKVKIKQLLGQEGIVLFKGSPNVLLQVIKDIKADILVAGSSNQYTALKAQIPFFDINHECDRAYDWLCGNSRNGTGIV